MLVDRLILFGLLLVSTSSWTAFNNHFTSSDAIAFALPFSFSFGTVGRQLLGRSQVLSPTILGASLLEVSLPSLVLDAVRGTYVSASSPNYSAEITGDDAMSALVARFTASFYQIIALSARTCR